MQSAELASIQYHELGFLCSNASVAIQNHGYLEIMNTDRSIQFTSTAFADALKQHRIQISMSGKGCCRTIVVNRQV